MPPDTSKWDKYRTGADKWKKYAKTPPVEEPGTGEKLWEAANTPIGERGFRAHGITGGIPEQNRFALANIIGKMDISDENKRRLAYTLDIPLEMIGSIGEAARRVTTPLGVATMGLGSIMQRLRDLAGVPKVIKAGTALAETGTGAAFGAKGLEEAATEKKGEPPLEAFERRLSGLGQSILGLAPVGHAIGPTGEKAAKTGIRSFSDAGASSVAEAERTAKSKQTTFEQEASQARAKARNEYEAAEAARQSKVAKIREDHAAAVAAAKAKHAAELEAYEQSLSGSVTKESHARLKNARLEKATEQMTKARDDAAQSLTDNLNQAEKSERTQLDARYEDFRKKILGVSEQNPNGTLKSELSPVGDAVQYAKKNLLKGSRTNITIFNDIMGRLKDVIETPEGELKPLAGQMIQADQLRGYQREIGDALYDKNLPGDVRESLKYVNDKINGEVRKPIEDVHGKGALSVYDDLSKDWSEYKRIWFDQSSVSPIPKIRQMLRDINVEKSGIDVHERVANLIKGERGRGVVKLLAEKAKFGADPRLAARVMALDEKLKALPGMMERVPIAKYPRVPTAKEVKPPEFPEEPKSAKIDLPVPPEPFNREEFIKSKVLKRMQQSGNWGSVLALGSSISDILHGNPGAAMTAAEKVAIVQALKAAMTSPGFLNWVAREGGVPGTARPPAAPPATPPREPPSTPTPRPGGPMGGINASGYEASLRPVSVEQQVNALRTEFEDLKAKVRRAPEGPEREQAIKRMAEDIQMILELERGGTQ